MVFLALRQRLDTIQALVAQNADSISKQMIKWTGSLSDESIVLVEGVTQAPIEEVKSVSIGNVEILVKKVRRSDYYAKERPCDLVDLGRSS